MSHSVSRVFFKHRYLVNQHTSFYRDHHSLRKYFIEELLYSAFIQLLDTMTKLGISIQNLLSTELDKFLTFFKTAFSEIGSRFLVEFVVSSIKKICHSSIDTMEHFFDWFYELDQIMIIFNTIELQIHRLSRCQIDLKASQPLFSVVNIQCYLTSLQYTVKLKIIDYLLSNRSAANSIIFMHVPPTKERITLYVKKLCSLFDPRDFPPNDQEKLVQFRKMIADPNILNTLPQCDTHQNSELSSEEFKTAISDFMMSTSTQIKQDRSQLSGMGSASQIASQNDHDYEYYEQVHRVRNAYEFSRNTFSLLTNGKNEEYIEAVHNMSLSLATSNSMFSFESKLYNLGFLYRLLTADKTDRLDAFRNSEEIQSMLIKFRDDSLTPVQLRANLLTSERLYIFARLELDKILELGQSFKNIGLVNSKFGNCSYLIGDTFSVANVESKDQCDVEKAMVKKKINTILMNALENYYSRKYTEFLHVLTESYAPKKILIGIRHAITNGVCQIRFDIRPSIVIDNLLNYQFAPESIADFLLLLGRVLLIKPKLKIDKSLTQQNRIKYPEPSQYVDEAILIFEELSCNKNLWVSANIIEKHILPDVLSTKSKILDSYRAVNTYPQLHNIFTHRQEKIHSKSICNLHHVQLQGKLNYATAHLFKGTHQNLLISAHTIRNIYHKIQDDERAENHRFLEDIRLKVILDIFYILGIMDQASWFRLSISDRNLKDSTFIDNSTIKKISQVSIDTTKIRNCDSIIFLDEKFADHLNSLDRLTYGIFKFNSKDFVQNLYDSYVNNRQPIKSLLDDIIRKQNLNSIEEMRKLLETSKIMLTLEYLPLVSLVYGITFSECVIELHREHRYTFRVKNKIYDLPRCDSNIVIYVLIDSNQDDRSSKRIRALVTISSTIFSYLHRKLRNEQDSAKKVYFYTRIARCYRHEAEKIDQTQHLESLKHWLRANDYYEKAMAMNEKHLESRLGSAACLIKLSKFTKARAVLNDRINQLIYYHDSPERWYYLGVLDRKMLNYKDARKSMEQAIHLRYAYVDAHDELHLIRKLIKSQEYKMMDSFKKIALSHNEREYDDYNVLAIDGGGIRGLIPAVWMAELEKRTGKHASSMFKMMAGTSTGAIITTGLSTPAISRSTVPRYKAIDLVDLYLNKAQKVFTPTKSSLALIGMQATYSSDDKHNLFQTYFQNIRLSQSLTELIVTAVQSGVNTTHLFTREDSYRDSSKNHSLVDILMCTTAAPTYFPPHNIKGTTFVDGGVQANNPAMFAYANACSKVTNRDRIFMLSLGTGDYVPDPLQPDANRNVLFWARNMDNSLKVVFDGPQSNIDFQLSHILGSDRYQRWQAWLEKPIVLDDVQQSTLDYMIELARCHFEEMDELDNQHRLGKLIERLRGPSE